MIYMKQKQIIILIGAPGSGKGTQAKLLSRKLGLQVLSPGVILRNEIAKKTVIGKKAAPFLKKGLLVSDDIVSSIVIKKIASAKKGIILDGFPRNHVQVKLLNNYLKTQNTNNIVIEIALHLSTAMKRISGRLTCTSCGESYHVDYKPAKKKNYCDKCGKRLAVRADSKPKVVKTRWQIYKYSTKPVLEYYKNHKYYSYRKVDGKHSISEVSEQIISIVRKKK